MKPMTTQTSESNSATLNGERYLQETRRWVDNLLDRFLPSVDREPKSLHRAMRYSVMAGGKRLRPILAKAAYDYCGGDTTANESIGFALAALEMVHTYSLIHDDLPCMDDDDLRRGIPTCHREFGEALAVLAGDALHVVAFELAARTGQSTIVRELAEAVGTDGMLGGQVADIEAEGKQVSPEEITRIHRLKTGALIRGSVRIGAILAGADSDTLARLTTYGEQVGLAFQIIDDLLDIEGDQQLLGKNVGSDSKNEKATYPGVVGMRQARQDAQEHIAAALAALGETGQNSMLGFIARYIGRRNR